MFAQNRIREGLPALFVYGALEGWRDVQQAERSPPEGDLLAESVHGWTEVGESSLEVSVVGGERYVPGPDCI